MQDAARCAAGGMRENVISSPIYMKIEPPLKSLPLKNVYNVFKNAEKKALVIDSDGGLLLAAHLMRKLQPSGKHKSEPVELINRD